jgi:hypothetical protein
MFKQKPNLFSVISVFILLLITVPFICQIGVTRVYGSDNGLQKPKLIPVYSLWNSKNEDHLLTTDANEKDKLASTPDCIYSGIKCYIFQTQQPNTVPLYRYNNPTTTDQYCTTDEGFKKIASNSGYHYEGILGYIYKTQQPNTVPLKQFYNEAMHDDFLMTDEGFIKFEKTFGYKFKTIEGYVFKTDQAQ